VTFPDDRVLVGAITRKKDLSNARDAGWYRVPQERLPRGVHAEYLAFFLNRRVSGQTEGGIYAYVRLAGVELAYRRDLLPDEADHPRAADVYYKVQLHDWKVKEPPVLNPTKRTLSFIYTTWDRFVHAQEIKDLYSDADYFVDRIYHALRNDGYAMERSWDAERRYTGYGAQLRILCQQGSVIGSTDELSNDNIFLDREGREDAILAEIRAAVAKKGGPVMISIPVD
jgi:hypothetical protein